MKKIAIHARKELKKEVNLEEIIRHLESCALEIHLTSQAQNHISKTFPVADFKEIYDLIIVVGGDGSILSVIRKMKHFRSPILPISAGTLGFLSEIKPEDFADACQHIVLQQFTTDERSLLSITIQRESGKKESFFALNDAVVSQSAVARMVSVRTMVNGEYLTTYRADGLILSTPTGSTAYSLAAGGPIVYPRFEALLLTPICPHALSHRSLLLPKDKVVEVFSDENAREKLVLTIDGQQGILLEKNDSVVVKISTQKLMLVRLPEEHFFKTIKRKMHWGAEE